MGIKQDRSTLPKPPRRPAKEPDAQARFGLLLAEQWHQEYLDAGLDFKPMAMAEARWRHSWAADCSRKIHYRLQEAIAISKLGQELEQRWYPDVMLEDDEITVRDEFTPWDMRLIDLIASVITVRAEFESTEPMSIADHWRFGIGTAVHDMLQAVVKSAFPEAEAEVRVKSSTSGAGTIDLVVKLEDTAKSTAPYVIAIEIKTINGFGFKRMIGDRGNPEGPRFSSIVQLALNAAAIDADEAVLIVLSLENLSSAVLRQLLSRMGLDSEDQSWRRFLAEYTYTREEYLPLAQAEHRRMERIIELTDEGKLVPRAIPDLDIPPKARITDPRKGLWELVDDDGMLLATGSTWHCDYCENRTRCLEDGPS